MYTHTNTFAHIHIYKQPKIVLESMASIASSLTHQLRTAEDDKASAQTPGTLNSLRKLEDHLMLLCRDVDRYRVELCEGVTGRDFSHQFRSYAEVRLEDLQTMKYSTPPNNRHFYGFAKLAMGGHAQDPAGQDLGAREAVRSRTDGQKPQR